MHGRSRSPCRKSDRNLAPDLDHLLGRQSKKAAHVNGVAVHYGEECFQPSRQCPLVVARNDGFVPHVIREVVEGDLATVLVVGLLQKGGDIGPLHEAVTSATAPE